MPAAQSIEASLPPRVMRSEVTGPLSVRRAGTKASGLTGMAWHHVEIAQQRHAYGIERHQEAVRVGSGDLLFVGEANDGAIGALDLANVATGDHLRDVFDVHDRVS